MSHTVQLILAVYAVLAIPLGYVAWSLCRASANADRRMEREVRRPRQMEMEVAQ